MEYINDININQTVIHVLDRNASEPVLNEYILELNDEVYKFLLKHIEKCLKDDELKYAKFKQGTNLVKETVQGYLNGIDDEFIGLSKRLAKQLFAIMQMDESIDSCDLIIVSLTTDQGPMIGILKLDYVKNFTHEIQFIDEKIGVGIVPQIAGLPGSSQKIEKAAFIKPYREDNLFNLYVLDKKKRTKEDAELRINYFVADYLYSTLITNERDNTKSFINNSETWIRKNVQSAEDQQKIRDSFKNKVIEEDIINIEEVAKEVLKEPGAADNFKVYMAGSCEEEFGVDKTYVEKKVKKVRLNIDREIDLYISNVAYNDQDKFDIVPNGDGSVNMIIKNVMSYIEK
ncbi:MULTISPECIES: nucleoid-associated protein [unclassified Clostridium]|uniref:nucleoid-associated protein n=1 Tax=unclassified Clostridium TaxID=2614128 RepID=UPI0013FC7975|nr:MULTISPECIES: nucleoid-associated protein [unclassified Clostridium]NFR85788.1 nucleoid-associated protein [Clostridium botulinum]NFR91422.1 nucleoid-associated protein [Clostridium botulinum]NFT99319.1 nucleoid-associated protein [Clostridium botulinum]